MANSSSSPASQASSPGRSTSSPDAGPWAPGGTRTDGDWLERPPPEVRRLVVADAELSELLMRTFLLRRVLLITRRLGDVVLVGSRRNPGTLQLMEFLTRNGHPYGYLDVEEDPAAQSLL